MFLSEERFAQLSIGHKVIDDQHLKLIQLANKVDDELNKGNVELATNILNTLTQDMIRHFCYEEAIMMKSQYPHLDDHMLQHQQIIEDLESLKLLLFTKNNRFKQNVMSTIEQALVDHIEHEDKRIIAHLNTRC